MMEQKRLSKNLYLFLGALNLGVILYGWWLNGIGAPFTWFIAVCVSVSLILHGVMALPEKEDERDKLVKYKSTQATFIGSIVIGLILLFTHQTLLSSFTKEDLLSVMIGMIILIQVLSQFSYNKLI